MNDVQRFNQLIKNKKFVMFTTKDAVNSTMHSRPMTLQEIEFDGDLWFFASRVSDLAKQIEKNPEVNLALSDIKNDSFISALGVAELIEGNKEKEKELWNPIYKAWFPEGLEDPQLVLIKVTVESVDYWESPDSKLVRLVGFAKAILGGHKNNKALGDRGHLILN